MARSFNGSQYLTITDNAGLDATAALTIAAWVYPTAWGSSGDAYIHNILTTPSIAGVVHDRVDVELRIGYGGSDANKQKLRFVTYTDDWHEVGGLADLTLNVWQHVAVTLDGSKARFYINGALDNDPDFSTTPTNRAGVDWLIAGDWRDNRRFEGRIAHVHYYKATTLTVGQIIGLMYRPGSCPTGLTFHIPIWGVGTPEPDLSGNGFSAAVTGATVADHAPVQPPFGYDVWVPYVVAGGSDATLPAELATATALSNVATIGGGAKLSGVLTTASASSSAATLKSISRLVGEVSTATALSPAGTLTSRVTVLAILATATALSPASTFVGNALISGALASASVLSPAATMKSITTLLAGAGTATALMSAATVLWGQTMYAQPSLATADLLNARIWADMVGGALSGLGGLSGLSGLT